MEVSYIAYLLFVVPGFCLVWTYRHFTRASHINDFEYAAWSLLWGTVIFLFFGIISKLNTLLGISSTEIYFDISSPFSLLGSILGASLAFAIILAFPIGYGLAFISKLGLFKFIDQKLFSIINKFK